MSTIRVSGDSSGYYDLTVPSTAGTNTIDLSKLPTTSAKTLAVDAINHTDGTAAITVDSSGRVSRPNTPLVAVRSVNQSYFGTNHNGTTYDITYRSPLPTFTSANRTTLANQGGGTLSFVSYAGGEYAKYVVPITGIYEYTFYGGLKLHSDQAGDWVAMGIYVNNATVDTSGNMDFICAVTQVYNPQDAIDDHQANMSFTLQLSLNASDYIVPAQQSTGQSAFVDTALHGFSLKFLG